MTRISGKLRAGLSPPALLVGVFVALPARRTPECSSCFRPLPLQSCALSLACSLETKGQRNSATDHVQCLSNSPFPLLVFLILVLGWFTSQSFNLGFDPRRIQQF